MPASKSQISWSNGSGFHKIKILDVNLFIACCHQRFIYDLQGATREQWLELAAKYQEAKGKGKISYMAEYCMRKSNHV